MPNYSYPLPNEAEINLDSAIVVPSIAAVSIENGLRYIRLNNTVIHSQLCTLPKEAVDTMYAEVAVYTTSETECVTGLRFYYGASDAMGSLEMKLYFEPLYLISHNYDPATETKEFIISEVGSMYHFDGTTLHMVSNLEKDQATLLFHQNVSIKRTPTSPNFEPYVLNEDVRSAILPFQELYALMYDNGADNLSIYNNAVLHSQDGSALVKESLILHTELISSNGPFAGMFSDRVHLCPNKCSIISLQINENNTLTGKNNN